MGQEPVFLAGMPWQITFEGPNWDFFLRTGNAKEEACRYLLRAVFQKEADPGSGCLRPAERGETTLLGKPLSPGDWTGAIAVRTGERECRARDAGGARKREDIGSRGANGQLSVTIRYRGYPRGYHEDRL